jgi:hypothetical protein
MQFDVSQNEDVCVLEDLNFEAFDLVNHSLQPCKFCSVHSSKSQILNRT